MTLHDIDRWLGPALIVFSVVWLWLVFDTIPPTRVEDEPGPRGFPLLLGTLLALLGLIMTISALVSPEAAPEEDRVTPVTGREIRIVTMTILLLLIYAWLLSRIGFLLATPLMLVTALWLIAGQRQWIRILLVAAGLTLGSYLVFTFVMQAHLPRGAWLPSL